MNKAQNPLTGYLPFRVKSYNEMFACVLICR